LRDVHTAAALVSRGRRAGATCATAFADWLIIDEEWFGPCESMDTVTYQRWRRRAEAIYSGPSDVYVSAHNPFTDVEVATSDPLVPPEPSRCTKPSAPPDPEASKFVKAFGIILVVLLLVALASASEALSKGPTHRAPSSPAPHDCSIAVAGTCAGTTAAATLDNGRN
jgi:hypothetical protein